MMRKKLFMLLYRVFAKRLPPYQKYAKRFRALLVRHIIDNPPNHFSIEHKAEFEYDLIIGENSNVGIRAVIPPMVTIGDNVMMGPDCHIFTAFHEYSRTDIPMIQQGYSERKPVVIGSHCLQNKQSVKFSINSAFFIEMCYNKCKKIIKSNKKACT